MENGVSKELSELKEKALTEIIRGIKQELAITKGYLELFNILVNTKFKVRGNRSCLPKAPPSKAMPILPKARKEKKEKRNGR